MDLDLFMSGRLVTAVKFSTTVTVTDIQIYLIQWASVRPLSAKMFLGILNLALRQSPPPTRLERLRMLKFSLQILETPVQIIIQVRYFTVYIRVFFYQSNGPRPYPLYCLVGMLLVAGQAIIYYHQPWLAVDRWNIGVGHRHSVPSDHWVPQIWKLGWQ